MEINKKQQLSRKRILDLEIEIQKSIDTICEKENFKITYSEINKALLNIINSNNGHELKELWKK